MRTAASFFLATSLLAAAPPAKAEAPPIEVFGELPAVEDMDISDSGTKVAALSTVKGQRMIVVANVGGGVITTAPVGDSKIRGVSWAGDDYVLISKSVTQDLGSDWTVAKSEFTGTIILPLDGKDVQLVFGKQPLIADFTLATYGVRQVGGAWKGYYRGLPMKHGINKPTFSQDFNGNKMYEVDFATNNAREVAASPAGEAGRSWMLDGNGKIAAMLDFTSRTGDWKLLSADGRVLASGVQPRGELRLIALGKDGNTVVYEVTEDDGEDHMYEVALAGGAPQEFLPDITVDQFYYDPRTGRLTGYLEETATGFKPVLYDSVRQAAVEKIFKAFPGKRAYLSDASTDFSKVLVRTTGGTDPGTWYFVDVTALRAVPLGVERPGLRPDQIGKVSVIEYKAADGLEMNGILTLPPGREAKNLPVILLPHGGPHSHDNTDFDWWAQAYASRGYAVFQPNFRGSTNKDDAFKNAAYNEWGRKMQTDISDGLAELAKRGIVDPKRACIVGASYGGYAALAGVTLQKGIYRCAVSVAGVSDVETDYDQSVRAANGDRASKLSMQKFLGDPAAYKTISPRFSAAKADAPIMLIHGKDDIVVPYEQSAVMAGALKSAGKPYEMVVLVEEDHWLSRAVTRKQMLTESVRFLEKHNPPQ